MFIAETRPVERTYVHGGGGGATARDAGSAWQAPPARRLHDDKPTAPYSRGAPSSGSVSGGAGILGEWTG